MSKKDVIHETEAPAQQRELKISDLDQLKALMKPMLDIYQRDGILKALQETPELIPKPETPKLTDLQELKILLKSWLNAFGPRVFWETLDYYGIKIPEDISVTKIKRELTVQMSTIAATEISGSHDKIVFPARSDSSKDTSSLREHWTISMREDGWLKLYFKTSKVMDDFITFDLKNGDSITRRGRGTHEEPDDILNILSSYAGPKGIGWSK